MPATTPQGMGETQQVVVIGLDGATLDLIEPWAAAGYLPHLAGLMARGTTARLRSTTPPLTGPAWSSFMTGVNPGQHGIYDFVGFRPNSYHLTPNTAAHRATPTLWHLLSQTGRRVSVINVPLTYPPENVNGVLISGLMTPTDADDFIYPADYRPKLHQVIPDYSVQPPGIYFAKGREAALIAATQAMTAQHIQAALHLMQDTTWEFYMAVLMATDIVQHAAWHYMDATHRDHTPSPLRDAILDCYRQVDAGVGQLVATAGPDATILIMSDHGFGPLEDYFYLNTWLWRQGWLRLKDSPRTRLKKWLFEAGLSPLAVARAANRLGLTGRLTRQVRRQRQATHTRLRSLFLSFEDVDWAHTQAYSLGNAGAIWLNRQGRGPQGWVATGSEAERIMTAIEEALRALRHPRTGQPVIGQVMRGTALYHGARSQLAPDLVCIPADWRVHPFGQVELPARRWLEPTFDRSGGHRPEGVLIAAGPTVRQGSRHPDCRMVDLAPTILGLLGAPLPDYLEGEFLAGLFTQLPALQRVGNSGDLPVPTAPELTPADEQTLRQQLKSLGYVA